MLCGVLREEAGDEVQGGGKGNEAPKTTVTINGKEVSMEKVAAAHQLYESLADPEVGKEIIEQLARRTGILKDGDTKITPKEEKQLEGKFTKLMKQKLGKDYDKFSDMLGPLFDEHLESLREEIKSELSSTSDAGSWESTVENFVGNHKFTAAIETEMQRLITRNGGRPTGLKGKAAREYLDDMYQLACHKLKVTPEEADNDEVEGDEPTPRSRRRSRRDEVPEFREEARPKGPLTIDQIVDAASRGIRFKQT